MSNLLLNERPLVVLPSLACAIGLNQAMLLQQLHFRLQHAHREHGGKRWYRGRAADWLKDFPFFSESTLRRIVSALKKLGLIQTKALDSHKCNQADWFTINEEKLAEIESLQTQSTASSCDHNDNHDVVNLTTSTESNCAPVYKDKIYKTRSKKQQQQSLKYQDGVSDDAQNVVDNTQSQDADDDRPDKASELLLLLNNLNVDWGVQKVQALIAKHGLEYFVEKVEVLRSMLKTKKIGSPGAYLQSALTYNYRPTQNQQAQTQQQNAPTAESNAIRQALARQEVHKPKPHEIEALWRRKSTIEQQKIFDTLNARNLACYAPNLKSFKEGIYAGLFYAFLENAWVQNLL